MASYFDEHDCEPTGDSGPELSTLIQWARLLMNDYRSFAMRFEGHQLPEELMKAPPASKEVVEELPDVNITTQNSGNKCPVCLIPFQIGDKCKELPCKHQFHHRCILPWLKQTNSCPVCRHELPTDDEDYEEYRKEKARAKQRAYEMESLHNSMYT
ncbi:E3 ubiquitin-protein ligase RNF181-like [Amphiura filiformis]|uniref:E3 ubiquitin-protein ligase RNF181-like n=1 Tax=Amphiura filiformis TaxID=82378 RepID=UPI003B228D7E